MTRLVRAFPLLPSLALSASLLTACAIAMGPPRTTGEALAVALFDAEGRAVGNVTLTADSAGLDLMFDVYRLTPGPHGVHIHEVGRCQRPDFLSAGEHLDDGAHHHGRLDPAGWHLGDLPNLMVGRDGTARTTLRLRSRTRSFSLRDILDRDDATIIIHAAPDDEHTDPSGNSGPRIACGIVA